MGKLISDAPSMKPQKGSSAKVLNPAGSGSRPTPSKHKTETSAPKDPHGLDGRKTPGALK